MSISFISHCHTDYSDVWPIYFDYLFKNSKTIEKIICVNNKNEMEKFFETKEYKYDMLIEYDETIPFASRMAYVLQNNSSEYVLYCADNNIISSCNEEKIYDIVKWLYVNNLDSVQLHMFKNDNLQIDINDSIHVYEIFGSEYPFSFLPSIWNRITLLNAYKSIPNCNYREFELEIIPFMNKYARVFRLKDVGQEKIKGWDCEMEPWFIFLHIIFVRKWCDETFFTTDYFKKEYNSIMEKYKVNREKLGLRTY